MMQTIPQKRKQKKKKKINILNSPRDYFSFRSLTSLAKLLLYGIFQNRTLHSMNSIESNPLFSSFSMRSSLRLILSIDCAFSRFVSSVFMLMRKIELLLSLCASILSSGYFRKRRCIHIQSLELGGFICGLFSFRICEQHQNRI